MKNKIIITAILVTLLTSCASWNSEDNPAGDEVKKFGGFIDNVKNKVGDKTKYSVLSKNRERNKELYYKDSLNKFLVSNYKTNSSNKYSITYVKEESLKNFKDNSKLLKDIYEKISNFCVNDEVNYPKFHKRKGVRNILNQAVVYPVKDQRILEYKLESKDVGNYIGEFACFKKYIGDIWTVSIGIDIEELDGKIMSFINIIPVESIAKRKAKSNFQWNPYY